VLTAKGTDQKGKLIRKGTYSFKTFSKKEGGDFLPVSLSFPKKRSLIRESRITGSPLYVPLGPLGPNALNPIPFRVTRRHGQFPLSSGLSLGFVKEDFEIRHLEPLAEFFTVIHPMCLKDLLERLEIDIIGKVLIRQKGNVRKAAEILGVKYTTLYFKVKKYRIKPVLFETLGHLK